MKNKRLIRSFNSSETFHINGTRIGTVLGVCEDGQVLVDFSGNMQGPIEARLTASARERLRRGNAVGKEVVLMFQDHDPAQPIIVDTLYSALDDILEKSTERKVKRPDEAIVDGKRITFDAEDEIVLQCGEASITLTRAGKVLIQGEYVLSSSSGANKIKGASVQIN